MINYDPTLTKSWKNLKQHYEGLRGSNVIDFFNSNSNRFKNLSLDINGLTVDFSKNLLNEKTIELLINLAKEIDLESLKSQLFSGEKINNTEDRSVLFCALRDRSSRSYIVDGHDVSIDIKKTIDRIMSFSNDVHSKKYLGCTGKSINKVIHIGIGGSDLGPRSVLNALDRYKNNSIKVEFISNINTQFIDSTLNNCDPETTIFLICSKSFGTLETLFIAKTIKEWLKSKLGDESFNKHLFAITGNSKKAFDFDISLENIFPIWEWVNGRYSLWSSVGLSIALGCSSKVFEELLNGASLMDRHFEKEPINKNLPVIMALLDIWNVNFLNCDSYVFLPYEYNLRKIPYHFQQLIMESNGKGVLKDGKRVSTGTSPIVFGSSGLESQHSYMQFIHQSPKNIHTEFIVSLDNEETDVQDHLIASVLAQSSVLMSGSYGYDNLLDSSEKKMEPHKHCEGNRSNTIVLLDAISPATIGSLIALFELRTSVQGFIWGINSFDQWGVELGKNLTSDLLNTLKGRNQNKNKNLDVSTISIWEKYLNNKRSKKI